MKYYLIAGEASGDLHASNLMRGIQEKDPQADFRYFGGDLMQSVDGTLVQHYKDLAFMGFIPVLKNLGTIFRKMDFCQKDIQDYHPDVVILIDYPGFNLKIAKHVKTKLNIPVFYYISPKIWAWKTYRIRSIRKYVDRMLCILPFEIDFYKKHNYKIDYVGNPTVDAIANRECADETFGEFIEQFGLPDKPIIALLAGSRKQEIKDNLPTMLEASSVYSDYQLVIAGAPGIDWDHYKQYTEGKSVSVVQNQTYRLLKQASAALVTSGTATLETGLLRVPQAVCYKVPVKHISSFVFKHFFSCPYISLVNLIANKTVVQELFGVDFSEEKIKNELNKLLNDSVYRQNMLDRYDEMITVLGKPGASSQAAEVIVNAL
jgi:lipid-A-disaccharide synthase